MWLVWGVSALSGNKHITILFILFTVPSSTVLNLSSLLGSRSLIKCMSWSSNFLDILDDWNSVQSNVKLLVWMSISDSLAAPSQTGDDELLLFHFLCTVGIVGWGGGRGRRAWAASSSLPCLLFSGIIPCRVLRIREKSWAGGGGEMLLVSSVWWDALCVDDMYSSLGAIPSFT